MKIKSQFANTDGTTTHVIYEDTNSFEHLSSKKVTQVYGVCFFDDTMLIVHNKDSWGLVGGSIKVGETYEECLKRETKEESNMKITCSAPIGYQEVQSINKIIYQLRYVCIVEPYNDFVSDPDGDVTEIKLINPKDYKKYFDWGVIGDRIVSRALELRKELLLK